MFGEFNEATQLKTSLAKYSIEFNDLAVQMRPHQIAYLRLLGGPYTLLYVRRSVDRLHRHVILPRFYKFIVQYFFLYQHVRAQSKPDHVGRNVGQHVVRFAPAFRCYQFSSTRNKKLNYKRTLKMKICCEYVRFSAK